MVVVIAVAVALAASSAFVSPSGGARASAPQPVGLRGAVSGATAPEADAGQQPHGAFRWAAAAALAAVMAVGTSAQPALANGRSKEPIVSSAWADLVASKTDTPRAERKTPSAPAESEPKSEPQSEPKNEPKPSSNGARSRFASKPVEEKAIEEKKSAFYAENRAELLEQTATKARGDAMARLKEAEQKSKAESLVRQLDAKRNQEEKARVAELEQTMTKRQAVLKQLEASKTTATKDNKPLPEGVDKPKAWAVFNSFFKKEEEKVKKEEAVIVEKETKRTKVLEELEKRKVAAEQAAREADEVARKIEALAKEARAQAEKARLQAAQAS